jgi:hypothetical protein
LFEQTTGEALYAWGVAEMGIIQKPER